MERAIGQITHYFNRIGVAVLALDEGLKNGDRVHIAGHTTDFTQTVESLEVEHHPVEMVGPGAQVALKVDAPVRPGDVIYKIDERAGILVGFDLAHAYR